MTIIITAFFMTAGLSIYTIIKLEQEKSSLHEARFANRSNARFGE